MKTLLYFEEYESNLSHKLFERTDILPIILRTTKNMRFFSQEYLKETQKYKIYIVDYFNDMDEEVIKFKKWLYENKLVIDYFLNDSEYYLEYSNKFAEKLGLNALSAQQILWVRDKVEMKKRFREIGLDTVDFYEVNDKNEINIF